MIRRGYNLIKKQIVCYKKQIRIDDMASIANDIYIADNDIGNEDINQIFKNLIIRKTEAITKTTRTNINLLFTKEQIDGDNSIFVIGYIFNPTDDLDDSSIVIKKYKVECETKSN